MPTLFINVTEMVNGMTLSHNPVLNFLYLIFRLLFVSDVTVALIKSWYFDAPIGSRTIRMPSIHLFHYMIFTL